MSNFKSGDALTDPSDWQKTKMVGMGELDKLQRCYICKEFFKAPVITSCNHTFCSGCIREYLLTNNLCPLCKSELYESNLKRDVLLEEIVTCYARLRSGLLVHLQPAPSAPESPSPRAEVIEIGSDSEEPAPKKARTESTKTAANSGLVQCPICSEHMTALELQGRHIDDCLSGKKRPAPTPGATKRGGITSFFKPKQARSHSPLPAATGSSSSSLGHADYYFNETAKHHNEAKKLSRLDFSSLSTPRLKEKLKEVKLPTSGTRAQLELRYNHYYVLYNSNLDSNRPLDTKILMHKLSQWEQSHSAFSTNSADLFSSRSSLSTKSITDKTFSPREWIRTYRREYRHLVRLARSSAEKGSLIPDVKSDVIPDAREPLLPSSSEPNSNSSETSDLKLAIASNPLFAISPNTPPS